MKNTNWKVPVIIGVGVLAVILMIGYEVQEYEYLDYNAPVDAPQDLFKED